MKKRCFNLLVFSFIVLNTITTSFFLCAMPSSVSSSEQDVDTQEEASGQVKEQQDTEASSSDGQTASDQQTEDESEAGPETTDFSEEEIGAQGNWVKKKDWLLKSYELRDQVNELIVQIQQARKTFDDKYENIDKDLDEFYKELGLDQGKLEELFSSLVRYLEKKKKQTLESLTSAQGVDKAQDREMVVKIGLLEEQVHTYAQRMEQLKLDMQSIEDLDKSLAERLQKVDEQIAFAVKEAGSAEKIIQTLWQIIDHNKARAQYYQLKGATLEKLQSIASYLEGALVQDFDRAGQTIRLQLEKTVNNVKALEEKGFIIKDRSRRIQSIKLKELKAEAEAEKKAKEQEPEVVLSRKQTLQKAWYGRYYDSFVEIVADSINFFQAAFARLFGAVNSPVATKVPLGVKEALKTPQALQPENESVSKQQVAGEKKSSMPGPVSSQSLKPVMPALPNPFMR